MHRSFTALIVISTAEIFKPFILTYEGNDLSMIISTNDIEVFPHSKNL